MHYVVSKAINNCLNKFQLIYENEKTDTSRKEQGSRQFDDLYRVYKVQNFLKTFVKVAI